MRETELLIPARDFEAGTAAVDHGADAVYIGGPGFGARSAAGNTVEDIGRLVDYAHPYRVKVYAALNTLIYENELRDAERLARDLVSVGVDALIVQDTALLMTGITGVAFHASTQMCNTTPEHVGFLARSGFSRVVLERGLTIAEVEKITETCGVETECFVHGAICVGHSGQCYLSRSMGPRSGNRGACAQPCRMKYDLEDGSGNVLIKDKYLLSVRDLNLSAYLGRMIDAGVTSFKVEGRLKETEYVKNITAYYRERLDAEISQRKDIKKASDGTARYNFRPDPVKSFSRGFTLWTAEGAAAGSASFDTPKSLGEPLGRVARVGKDYFILDSPKDLSPGDGICFIADTALSGTNINRVEEGRIYPNRMDGLKSGSGIYRNFDHSFNAILGSGKTRRSIPVEIKYTASEHLLTVVATDCAGHCAEMSIDCTWGPAQDSARMASVIATQLSKSGETVFEAGPVSGSVEGRMPFVPVSALNALRRGLLDSLVGRRLEVFDCERKRRLENVSRDDTFPYPSKILTGQGNVTNSLARRFWHGHGVETIEEPLDLRDSLDEQVVMVTPYCIRRETGTCIKQVREQPVRELYLSSGGVRYLLGFDCKNCRMSLVKCPSVKDKRK